MVKLLSSLLVAVAVFCVDATSAFAGSKKCPKEMTRVGAGLFSALDLR